MFDFGTIKKALAGYGDSLKTVRRAIEAVQREHEDVMFAPTTRADARAAMVAWVESQATVYRESITKGLLDLALNRHAIEDAGRFNESISRLPLVHKRVFGPVDGPIDLFVCALLGDILIKEFDKVLEKLPQPVDALSHEERKRKLEELDARLAGLRETEQKMLDAAAEVGMTVEVE